MPLATTYISLCLNVHGSYSVKERYKYEVASQSIHIAEHCVDLDIVIDGGLSFVQHISNVLPRAKARYLLRDLNYLIMQVNN